MLYLKCPTCKNILGNKQIPFEEELHNICENNDLTEQEKDDLKSDLLDKFNLDKYCCRMRILTYSKPIDIIK